MIQHYEICPTPLLDLTRSLRVACWFALHGAEKADSPVLYVFGMPYMHNRIALDTNAELFQMNLTSLLPPNAERPAFQEGVLVGAEQPDAKLRAVKDSDLSKRLLAKISLPKSSEFQSSLGLGKDLIYPDEDPFLSCLERVRIKLEGNDVPPVGEALRASVLRSGEAMLKAYADAVEALDQNMKGRKRWADKVGWAPVDYLTAMLVFAGCSLVHSEKNEQETIWH